MLWTVVCKPGFFSRARALLPMLGGALCAWGFASAGLLFCAAFLADSPMRFALVGKVSLLLLACLFAGTLLLLLLRAAWTKGLVLCYTYDGKNLTLEETRGRRVRRVILPSPVQKGAYAVSGKTRVRLCGKARDILHNTCEFMQDCPARRPAW